jgi:hypothetical protein
MADKNTKSRSQTLKVSPRIEWSKGQEAFHDLNHMLTDELAYLTKDVEIRNAYSPIAWARLCMGIKHLTEGMAAIRLHCEGNTNDEIVRKTGVHAGRIAAFKAWNTQYKKMIDRKLTLRGKNKEQRTADLGFLRSIGVSIVDDGDTK